MKAIVTWILIANGAHARIMQNKGVGKGIEAVPGMVFQQETDSAGDIMADRPGRSFDSVGRGRHAMEYGTNPVRVREKQFCEKLCETLERTRLSGKFARLLLVASPQTLGDLRKSMPGGLKRVLCGEIAKDLTHVPNGGLTEHLADVIAV